jgi:hypothetical protein
MIRMMQNRRKAQKKMTYAAAFLVSPDRRKNSSKEATGKEAREEETHVRKLHQRQGGAPVALDGKRFSTLHRDRELSLVLYKPPVIGSPEKIFPKM